MDLKILCYNIHKGIGWGVYNSTFQQILLQIDELNPDIIFLQEVRGHQFEIMTSGEWSHCSYGKNAVYQSGHHGNAILSKFPVLASDNIDLSMSRYDKRGLLHCIIHLPDKRIIHLFSVHLGLLSNDRKKQVSIIIKYMQENISDKDLIIMGGDFNDWKTNPTKLLISELNLHEAFLAHKKMYAKTFPAWMPVFKLDRLYYRGFSVKEADRLNSKSWRYLSDHLALTATLTL